MDLKAGHIPGAINMFREILGTDSFVDQVVSSQSPLGAAVLGHCVGDEVSYAAPNGRTISVTIRKVTS